MKKPTRRLVAEQLEDRVQPAAFGVAWPDAQHLKISFVPDGTAVDGTQSVLSATLNAGSSTAAWQTAILQALQTWASQANINIGLVGDVGQAVGADGAVEGDSRFGDIRVGGHAMPGDVVAISSPYEPLAGTRSGDMMFNTAAGLGVGSAVPYDLFTVALHEAGHVFGLGDNSDPTSVMYGTYTGARTGLSQSDIANLQTLYGTRAPDAYEGATSNDSLATARPVALPNVEAEVSSHNDLDFYKYTLPFGSGSSVAIQVQTAGLSLLTAKLTVYNSAGQVVASGATTDPLAGGVTVTLNNATPGGTYYLKVEGSRADAFGVGSYRLKVHSGPVSEVLISSLDALYSSSYLRVVWQDNHGNDTLGSATSLNQAAFTSDPRFANSIAAKIEDTGDVDFYRVTAPATADGSSQAMVVSVSALKGSGLDPMITVYDQNGNNVNADVLVNDSGSYLVQVANAAPGSTYVIKVSSGATGSMGNTGNYLLGVNFRSSAIVLDQYVNSTLSGSTRGEARTMTVNQTQVTHLVLSADPVASGVATKVRMVLIDQDNNVVTALDALAGQTVSADVFLKKGTYTVAFVAATIDHSALPALNYRLRGEALTDPIGPVPIDPTDPPPTEDPTPIVIAPDPPPNPAPIIDAIDPWAPVQMILT